MSTKQKSTKKKSQPSQPSKQVARNDGWKNILTGLNIKNKDKKANAEVFWQPLVEHDVEALFAGDAMARKIVMLPVQGAMEKGYKIKGFDKEQNEALEKRGKMVKVDEQVFEAWWMGRAYGGAGLVLVTDGFAKPDLPMSDKERLKAMNVLTRYELWLTFDRIQKNILMPNYGRPQYYTLQPRLGNTRMGRETANTKDIHWSRVIQFNGLPLPKTLKIQNGYWDDSVLNPIQEALRNYQVANAAATSVVEDFSVAIMKIKNLADKVASDGDEEVINRMGLVNLTRSIARAVVVDAEGEDFDYKTRSVTGIPEILAKTEEKLTAETNMPNTVLFGNSPAGLGGSGNHETNNWYDYLRSEQKNTLKPRLLQIYKLLALDLGLDPSKVDIEFNPLEDANETEEATIRKTQAETDQIYMQNGVIDPDEVAKSRFGSEKYSTETHLEHERTSFAQTSEATKDLTPEELAALNSSTPSSVQATAMNGAQVTSMVEVIKEVGLGNIPSETAILILMKAFSMERNEAAAIINPVKPGSIKPEETVTPAVPTTDAQDVFKVGDTVKVKAGSEHMPEHKGLTFKIEEIQQKTVALKQPDGSIHKWYTFSEIEKA